MYRLDVTRSSSAAAPELLRPYRRVAVRVIALALRDLANSGESLAARAFLRDSRLLHHWCAVADIDPARVMARARVVLTELQRPERHCGTKFSSHLRKRMEGRCRSQTTFCVSLHSNGSPRSDECRRKKWSASESPT